MHDATPSPLLDSQKSNYVTKRKFGDLRVRSQHSTLSTKRGRGACWGFGIRLGKGISYLVIRSCIQNQPTSWLKLILHSFGVGTSHWRPWTHFIHHSSDSREATTFPHIVFYVALRGGYIQMALFPRTLKEESRNCPGLDSRDFGHP